MRIATSWSVEQSTEGAIDDAFERLKASLDNTAPSLIFVFYSSTHDGTTLSRRLEELAPGVPVHGGSSCLGVMTAEGIHSDDGFGLGLWTISDPEGDYGVGMSHIGDDPRLAGARAVEQALLQADREGEMPALVWLNSAPGREELVLEGIASVVGASVPVIGGSTADNDIAGEWTQVCNGEVDSDAVVACVLFPSVEIGFTFHNGYEPTEKTGIVTRGEGRVLHEIDGRPAAQVYNEWTGGLIEDAIVEGGNVLASTTMAPLGREVGRIESIPEYKLSHPETVTSDGAITLFSEIVTGNKIVLMTGSMESLTTRAGRVARSAARMAELEPEDISGALVVYCAGCMLAVRDNMDAVVEGVSEALNASPFIGLFTFGEQGCFLDGTNVHGNLMISTVVFAR